jgi:type 1 glutamine amidotransferase
MKPEKQTRIKRISRIAMIILFSMLAIAVCGQPDNRFRQPHSRNQFQILLYTSHDKWHNLSEPVAILELQEMAQRHAFGLTWTTIPAAFNDKDLEPFDAVVFLHATSRDLSGEQLGSLKRFIQAGKGFVGIHATSTCSDEGEWFRKLVGRTFVEHPEEQSAVMKVVSRSHPSTMHLNENWLWTDEWYSFSGALTPDQKVLITVDESTYNPARCWGNTGRNTAMGKFHPVAWYQKYDGGRSFYTALGHMPSLYKDPWFLAHIYGGIFWAATGKGIN